MNKHYLAIHYESHINTATYRDYHDNHNADRNIHKTEYTIAYTHALVKEIRCYNYFIVLYHAAQKLIVPRKPIAPALMQLSDG